MEKKSNEKVITFFIILLFSLIMCNAFLKPHYTYDTYRIANDGYQFYSYDKFLKEGRPFSALVTIIANTIKLPIETYCVISFLIAIILLSLAVMMLYEIITKKKEVSNKTEKIILYLIAYITIFSYLAIEHIVFLECCIISLGIFLSILACKVLINHKQYCNILAFILLFTAVFCYQGSIAIFPMVMLMYYALIEPISTKEYVKKIIQFTIMYGTCMLCNIVFVKLISGDSRITMGLVEINWKDILASVKRLVIYSLNVIPPFTNIGIIVITSIYLLIHQNNSLFRYWLIILASICICIMPILTGTGLNLEPRMCISYGTTIGISLLYIFYDIKERNNLTKIIVCILVITLFILNFLLYHTITHQNLKTNQIDKDTCEEISKIIEQYENETGKRVTKIAGLLGQKHEYEDNVIKVPSYNQKSYTSWAMRETIIFYTNRKPRFYSF